MDDGAISGNSYILCTSGFIYEDILRLKDILSSKLNLDITIQGLNTKKITKHYNLYIKQKSASVFRNIIEPYVIPSMLYKLHI